MEEQLLHICLRYRFMSLLASTIVYLFIPFEGFGPWRMVVAVGMIAATALGASMYREETMERKEKQNRIPMYFEVIAYGLFIVFSGGFYSPYLWCAFCSLAMVIALRVSQVVTCVSILWCFACAIAGQYLGLIPVGRGLEVNVGLGVLVLTVGLYTLFLYVRRLIDSQHDLAKLQELLGEYATAQEQSRIGGELHDTVIQKLFAVICRIHVLGEQEQCQGEMHVQLKSIGASIEGVMRELREAIYGMRWSNEDLFCNKLKMYMDEIQEANGTEIILNIDSSVEIMTAFQKTTFYRIICEGVNNAVRHGKATRVEVSLGVEAEQLSVLISDNGCGFQVTNGNRKNQGMGNMQNLIALMKGQLQIESKETGTQIIAWVPR